MEYPQPPETENENVIRMLRAAINYETITPEEAAAYYLAYLDIVEEEHQIAKIG